MLLISDCRILDGSGSAPFAGEVLIDGARIRAVSPTLAGPVRKGARIIDAQGATLMPGLIESHSHLTFLDRANSVEMGFVPAEEHILLAARNARTLLDAGFTSCMSAASAKPRLDVVLREAIDCGDIPGPRTLAATPEMTVAAGLGDVRLLHMFRQNFAVILDGANEYRRYSRSMCREGVDTLKINISGDAGTLASPSQSTVMTEAEIAAVCEVAQAHGLRVAAHARNTASVRLCVKHGVQIIYHANLIDDDCCALLQQHRERIFVAPTLGHTHATLYEAAQWGITTEMAERRGLGEEYRRGIENMKTLKRAGVRVLPGGDYGFAWNRNGRNARDIEHFVNLLGFSAMDAVIAATRLGGEIMMRGHELGQVREGYLADLLLVDGDPLSDVRMLQDPRRLLGIMKDGKWVREPSEHSS
jgi:imidazolonepropionase-like amidohydrolase